MSHSDGGRLFHTGVVAPKKAQSPSFVCIQIMVAAMWWLIGWLKMLCVAVSVELYQITEMYGTVLALYIVRQNGIV